MTAVVAVTAATAATAAATMTMHGNARGALDASGGSCDESGAVVQYKGFEVWGLGRLSDSSDFFTQPFGLSDNVTYFAEQLETVDVSVFHHRITFKPQAIVPDIDFRGSTEELLENASEFNQ